MKTLHTVTITAAAVALLALSAPVTAYSQMKDTSMKGHQHRAGQMTEMGNMDMMGDMMGTCIEHADRIGLSDDQVAKMKPAHRDMQKKQAQYKADLKIAEIELMEIMELKDFDLEKAGAAVKKIADIKTAHHLGMLAHMKEIRTMLTAEQFKNMQKMMAVKGEKKPVKMIHKKR